MITYGLNTTKIISWLIRLGCFVDPPNNGSIPKRTPEILAGIGMEYGKVAYDV